MNVPKIDFKSNSEKVDTNITAKTKRPKKRWPFLLLKIGIYLIVFLVIFGVSISYKVILSSEGIFSRQDASLIDQIKHLVTSGDKTIKGEETDRINILLVGMGGQGHDGAYLADTIIVASLKPSTQEVALLSIPRDLYVPIPDYGWRKINNANAFGYQEDPEKGGEQLLADVLEDVLGQPIQYYASVDFSGFKKLVDLVGGVEINIERSFTDYEYPDNNYGYEPISFTAGDQIMNGEIALKYVRSRHGNNNEGSDFARSRRQQKVMAALKKKIFSLGTLINPKKVVEISQTVGDHLKTDMEVWEIMRLAELLKDIDTSKIVNRVLDTSPTGLLYSETTIDGAYILKPRAGDFSEIQSLARDIFQYTSVAKENARIEIQNGTQVSGLAETTANHLREMNYEVVKVTNADLRNLTTTQIYDLSLGQKPDTLKFLKKELNCNIVTRAPIVISNTNIQSLSETDENTMFESSFGNLTNTPMPEDKSVDLIVVLGSDILDNQSLFGSANTNITNL